MLEFDGKYPAGHLKVKFRTRKWQIIRWKTLHRKTYLTKNQSLSKIVRTLTCLTHLFIKKSFKNLYISVRTFRFV